jgi:hypothetical protein
MEERSDSDSACGRLGVGVEEMIRGALGSVSARKKGMAGRG